jgi:hypothetical protein
MLKLAYLCGQTALPLNSTPTLKNNVFQFQSTGRACKYVDASNSLMLLSLVPPWVNHPVKKKR